MASSSSSHDQCKFDVFLSFRGEDTRHNFISHLHDALDRKNILTFIDDRLQRGEEISPALSKAIKESKVSVIIFSKDYASSKWCLDELVKIIECKNTNGQIVIPVFYRVNPSDVLRKQSGSFEDAFADEQAADFKEKMEKVQRWRDALKEASNLSSWDSEVTKPESRLVDEIVKFVLKKLNHMSSSEFEGLVGIEPWIKRLNSLLCIGSLDDVRILGLWGIGGIGKTTIAEAFFNRFSSQFEACYFLANVREQSEKLGLDRLKEEFLSKLLEDKNLYIGTPHIGSTFVKDRLNRKKVLIVFDDVSKSSQLETLVGGHKLRFGLGSRIIITSRDKQVLDNWRVDHIQKVEGLKEDEALQLFCQYAFKQNRPTKYQLDLSHKAASYARGNPLALKVLGSSLFGKSEREWKSKLEALERTGNKEIEQVLKISFDGLDVEKKDIFLYIACFFKWEGRDYVTKILDACGYSTEDGISVLIDKALITVSNSDIFPYAKDNSLSMHDLLQDLGRHIVREESITEPGKRRMLWNHDDICHVLEENTGTEIVEGIFLDMSEIREVRVHPEAFARMYNLKLLKFYDPQYYGGSKSISKVHLSQGLKSLPNQLRSLFWHGYPLKSLPSKFHPEKLVELDMRDSHVEKLWKGVQPLLVNLKRINLNCSQHLKEMPDLSRAPNLESIILKGCDKIRSLKSSIYLEYLGSLILGGCSKLKKFPEVSLSITKLDLSETTIEEVPTSIEYCRGLTTLDLKNCTRLKNLPNSIFNLESLDCLILYGCSNITEFPKISRKIGSLNLSETAIEKVPSSIESLSQLIYLDLRNCRKFKSLPTSICKLKLLKKLHLSGCSKLENFPEILEPMKGLENLDLNGTAIKELPSSVEHLINLTKFLSHCKSLVSLPNGVCNLKSLCFLSLSNCSNLIELPENLGNLKLLERLEVDGAAIKQLPESLGGLSSLKCLSLHGNTFEKIPATIKQLSRLLSLTVSGCKRLQSLPELPSSLLQLDASDCTSLETVSCNDMHMLKELRFTNCIKLHQDARNKIVAAAQLRFQNIPTVLKPSLGSRFSIELVRDVSFCYPGSEFPEWFSHQCVGSSLTITSDNKFVHIVVGANIAFHDEYEYEYDDPFDFLSFYCHCRLMYNDGRRRSFSQMFHLLYVDSNDHIFLLYHEKFCGTITEASLEIQPVDPDEKTLRDFKVKKMGVFLYYAQNDDYHYPIEDEEEQMVVEEEDDDYHYSTEEEEEPQPKVFKFMEFFFNLFSGCWTCFPCFLSEHRHTV